jgi:hypothetical protein
VIDHCDSPAEDEHDRSPMVQRLEE